MNDICEFVAGAFAIAIGELLVIARRVFIEWKPTRNWKLRHFLDRRAEYLMRELGLNIEAHEDGTEDNYGEMNDVLKQAGLPPL